jgi:hypothetical protein
VAVMLVTFRSLVYLGQKSENMLPDPQKPTKLRRE